MEENPLDFDEALVDSLMDCDAPSDPLEHIDLLSRSSTLSIWITKSFKNVCKISGVRDLGKGFLILVSVSSDIFRSYRDHKPR